MLHNKMLYIFTNKNNKMLYIFDSSLLKTKINVKSKKFPGNDLENAPNKALPSHRPKAFNGKVHTFDAFVQESLPA